jgi:protein-tyrosine phosphatase
MKILMVCLGNICRSPLAEGILQQKADKAGLKWAVSSAGTNGCHNGEAPHFLSQKVAKLHGIDISQQCSRQLTLADFNQFDKIYALAPNVLTEMKHIAGKHFNASKVDILMNVVYPGQNIEVPDPFYGSEAGYHPVFDMITQACDKIIENATRP